MPALAREMRRNALLCVERDEKHDAWCRDPRPIAKHHPYSIAIRSARCVSHPPATSIVSSVLNEADHVPALCSGLLRQTFQPGQVILVDSRSTDDSVAIAASHGSDIVHVVPADFSFG